jgi:hypothetical protein
MASFSQGYPAPRLSGGLFSADVTPIAGGISSSNINTRTDSLDSFAMMAGDGEAIFAKRSGDGLQLPTHTLSNNSLLNNALIMDTPQGSAANTPSSCMTMAGDSKKGADNSALGFFFPPMPDNGPAMCFRNSGA